MSLNYHYYPFLSAKWNLFFFLIYSTDRAMKVLPSVKCLIVRCKILTAVSSLLTLTTKRQTTKFSSANFSKNIKYKLYYIENSKTRGQTV